MPDDLYFWMAFFVSLIVAAVVTPLTIVLAKKTGIMDVPTDKRRLHSVPKPRFGGLAIFLGINVSLIIATVFFENDMMCSDKVIKVMFVGLFVFLLGAADDIFNLLPKIKLLGQVIAGVALYFLGVRLEIFTIFGHGNYSVMTEIITLILTVIWIIAITNTINLIDGVDGLAAGISIIASLCIAYVAYKNGYYITCVMMLTCAGSATGFIPFNFYPAKTFMGDGGSLFLGYALAAFSMVQPVKGATVLALFTPIIVLFLPILDTSFAIIRRIVNRKPIMSADKGHIHHRLMKAGMGQRRTVVLMYCISGIMGIAAILFSDKMYIETVALLFVAIVILSVLLTDANHWVPRIKESNDEENQSAPIIISDDRGSDNKDGRISDIENINTENSDDENSID